MAEDRRTHRAGMGASTDEEVENEGKHIDLGDYVGCVDEGRRGWLEWSPQWIQDYIWIVLWGYAWESFLGEDN